MTCAAGLAQRDTRRQRAAENTAMTAEYGPDECDNERGNRTESEKRRFSEAKEVYEVDAATPSYGQISDWASESDPRATPAGPTPG